MVMCLVCQAARATSAAPTFFPIQKIDGRSFVDGGLEFNNPSHAIFQHYSQPTKVAEARRASGAQTTALRSPNHGDLDFSEVRFINLGTGTKPDDSQADRSSFFVKLVPPAIRMWASLTTTLEGIAVDSEKVADVMKSLEHVSGPGGSINVKYERFSANNGICTIAMDRFNDLGKIESLTWEYLGSPQIQKELKRVAEEIARDYLHTDDTRIHPASLTVPRQRPPRPQVSISKTPEKPQSSLNTQSSRSNSGTRSESSANRTSTEPSPSIQTTIDITPDRSDKLNELTMEGRSFPAHRKTSSVQSTVEELDPFT
jgi:hypothetical protein